MLGIGSVCWLDMQEISGITDSVGCEERGLLGQVGSGWWVCLLLTVFSVSVYPD